MNAAQILKTFYQATKDEPLEAGDPRYVPLYAGPEDPVRMLARAIQRSGGESVQLLSGFRGTGKSTELRRLSSELIQEGYKVILIDVLRYLSPSMPIVVSDFLLVIAGAFGEALSEDIHLGRDLRKEGYWERFAAFLARTSITLPDASASGIKLSLKTDPTFRRELQDKLDGHLGALYADVRAFFEEGVKAIKARHGAETEIVMLVDSIEQIRGAYDNTELVLRSVTTLFARHFESLKLPNVHVIYTIPPYLKVLAPSLGALYGAGAIHVFPAIKVRDRDGNVSTEGLVAVADIVKKRGKEPDDWRALLGGEDHLATIAVSSGGSIRVLLQLVREIIVRTDVIPVSAEIVEAAVNQVRLESVPIANNDALWLSRIAETHTAELEDGAHLPTLAKYFDGSLVLAYRDSPEWYDVHPLIRDIVIKQAEGIRARLAKG